MNTDICFENHVQALEYMEALKSGFLPLKFAYIGKAAHTHDQLVRSKEYGIADIETQLIKASLGGLLEKLNCSNVINLIDIGSGNGLKCASIINVLNLLEIKSHCHLLDYGNVLLNVALTNLQKIFPDVPIDSHVVDFEKGAFQTTISKINHTNKYPNIFLLLGHTLGNPLNWQSVLKNIATSMRKGDYLLIGVELYEVERIKEILAHYDNRPFRDAVFNPLTFAGIDINDGVLNILFDRQKRNVEVDFVFKNAKYAEVETENFRDTVAFEKESSLKIFVSHRFLKDELFGALEAAGVRTIDHITDNRNTYMITVCQR